VTASVWSGVLMSAEVSKLMKSPRLLNL